MKHSIVIVALSLAGCAHSDRTGVESAGDEEIEQHPWLTAHVQEPPAAISDHRIDVAAVEDRLELAVRMGRIHDVPFKVDMVVTACGRPRGFYSPADHRITLCWEMIDLMSRGGRTPDLVPDIAEFVALHEIGHAVIDGRRLPVIGREEDAADAFASLFMIVGDNPRSVRGLVEAARFLRDIDHGTEFWDEHSFGEARYYSILCLVVGGSPSVGPDVETLVPASRRSRCPTEYEQTRFGWDTMNANANASGK